MVLGPSSPSSRRRVACCVGDPSIGGREIRSKMSRKMGMTRNECRLQGDGGGGSGEAARREGKQCVVNLAGADVVTWSK